LNHNQKPRNRTRETESRDLRLFVAVDLPADCRRELAEAQDRLRFLGAAVRWSDPEGIHLTLKFLGMLSPERLPSVQRALGEVCAGRSPFRLTLDGLGTFPSLSAPRVLWVGVFGEVDALADLQHQIEGALARRGLPRERRRFSPHLTLGRVREGLSPAEMQRIGPAVLDTATPAPKEIPVEAVSLVQSHLQSAGAQYTRLAAWPLGPEGGRQ
jgi:2'-5' RNA ligase